MGGMNELQRVVAELRAAGFADWASRIEAAQAVAPGEVEVLDPKGLAETMNVIADRIATRADRYFGRTGESDVQRMGFRGYAIELRMLASTVAAAPASEAKGYEVIEMRLCEAPHLILKRDQLYRFTVDPNCPQCREAAMAYEPAASSAAGKREVSR